MKYLILVLTFALAACNNSGQDVTAECKNTQQHGTRCNSVAKQYTTIIPNTKNNLDAALKENNNKLKDAEEK